MYRAAVSMIHSELRSASLAVVAPRRDAVTAEDAADGLRVLRLDRGDVEPELEARPAPRHPDHLVAEDDLGELLAVGRGRDRDPRVRMQVVHVCRIDQPVHRRVDRRRGTPLAVQAVVERGDHLVLALDAGIDVDEGTQAIEPEHRQPALGQRSEITAGALDPQQLDGSLVTGSVSVPLAEVFPPA